MVDLRILLPMAVLPFSTASYASPMPSSAVIPSPVKWSCASGPMSAQSGKGRVLRGGGTLGGAVRTMKLEVDGLHPHPDPHAKPSDVWVLTAMERVGEKTSLTFDKHHIEMKNISVDMMQGHLTEKEFTVRVTCWYKHEESTYRYQVKTGECLNTLGEQGMNDWPIERIRETGDAECARLKGVDLGEGNVSYPKFKWNLMGADLNGASLTFAHIVDAQLQGTKMKTLSYGYANVTGQGDIFTELPETGCEPSRDHKVSCSL